MYHVQTIAERANLSVYIMSNITITRIHVLIILIICFVYLGLDPFLKQLISDKGNPSLEWRINFQKKYCFDPISHLIRFSLAVI